jgi:hypothetical protein
MFAVLIMAAVAGTAGLSLQAQFDTASAAVDAGRCADAIVAFTALESRVRAGSSVAGVIALRKGRCLAALRRDEAEAVLTSGLATAGDAPAYTNDRAMGLIARGDIAYDRFDYPAAARDYAAGRDLLPVNDRFDALVALARATMFEPGNAARDAADAALAIAATAKVKRATVAQLRTLHARALLSHGDLKGGYAELRKALDEQGGLTTRVNAADIQTRSDLATAALLNHDEEEARKYLAFTGAGHGTPFGSAADMDPPPCDGDLQPDDRAIVEFGIADSGAVTYAVPVYVSHLGTAAAFARAVSSWSWKPEALAKIAPLFRAVTRVELRCSTASAPPSVIAILERSMGRWLGSRGVAPFVSGDSAAATLAAARLELVHRRATVSDVGLIPALAAIGGNPVAPTAERHMAITDAQAIAARTGAPVAATTLLGIAAARAAAADEHSGTYPARVAAERAALRDLLTRPDVAADPEARGVVRLLLTDGGYRAPSTSDAASLLRAVADDPALPEHDALRSAARVRLASFFARSGDLDAARTAYAASGVSSTQCSLVDARPVATSLSVSSTQFPQEALRWGFEGWVRLEFDVAADGRVGGSRAVIAYPPFVFGPSAVKASSSWRYQQSFRPDGVAGCNGAHQQIRFKIG